MAKDPPPHLKSGKRAEERAARYLEDQGLVLWQRNYRSPHGEIDLIMRDPTSNGVVFVEVRYRKSRRYGDPAETVDHRKQRKLVACAEHFLQRHRQLTDRPCRFDVISLSGDLELGPLQWLQDAINQ